MKLKWIMKFNMILECVMMKLMVMILVVNSISAINMWVGTTNYLKSTDTARLQRALFNLYSEKELFLTNLIHIIIHILHARR